MKTLTATIGLLAALSLSGCGDGGGTDPTPEPPAAETGDGSLSTEEVSQDADAFDAVADQMRDEFAAFADSPGSGPVDDGLQVCTDLHEINDQGGDVQDRYLLLLDEYRSDEYVSDVTGQQWVDVAIDQLCPELRSELETN